MDVARRRGHEVNVVSPLRCTLQVGADDGAVYCDGRPVEDIDAVVPRIDPSITAQGTAVLAQFEAMGVWSLNESTAIRRSRDKLRASQLLAAAGIEVPATAGVASPHDIHGFMARIGSVQVVIKPIEGSKGRGVVIAESLEAACSTARNYLNTGTRCIVQEFIRTDGSDIRCFVVGDRLVASIRRTAKSGEHRTNLHQGGSASAVMVTPQERTLAMCAAQTLGLAVAAVDLIRAPRGMLVMEVNSSPGLEGMENATAIDVAGAIIAHVEAKVRNRERLSLRPARNSRKQHLGRAANAVLL